MESTGESGRVQVSEATADILIASGKKHWLVRRKEAVHAKGKGEMHTYWLVGFQSDNSNSGGSSAAGEDLSDSNDALVSKQKKFCHYPKRMNRLIDWNVQLLKRLVQTVVAYQKARTMNPTNHRSSCKTMEDMREMRDPMGEVQEIITLPQFDSQATAAQEMIDQIEIDETATKQLYQFVRCVAALYR